MANKQNQNIQGGTSARQAKDELSTNSQEQKDSDSTVESVKESAKDTAKDLYDQAKGTAGQAYGAATKKAESAIGEKKANLASGLTSVADSLHQATENLREQDDQIGITKLTAKYGDELANQLERISDYFENKDPREMMRDVEGFARRNPEIFLGAAFTLGLLAARFLKSSGNGKNSAQNNRQISRSRKTGSETNNIKTLDNRSVNKDQKL